MKQLSKLGLGVSLALMMTQFSSPGAAARAPAKVSVDDMIGQLVMVGFQGTKASDPGVKGVMNQLARGQIGGVILLSFNVTSPAQLKRLTSALNGAALKAGRPRPLISIDQEGGKVQRLKTKNRHEPFPYSARTIASRCTPGQAYKLYRKMACQLRSVGVNVNFGPVVDVDLQGARNPIIGRLGRSFSRDPREVVRYAIQFNAAHKDFGILTAAKHYPGHGSSLRDSHKGFTDVTKTYRSVERIPFEKLKETNYADMVMSGHLFHPDFSDGQSKPASLSKKALRALRVDMGFEGVIITDDLQMRAVQAHYKLRERIALAVNAGNDILLFSNTIKPRAGFGEMIYRMLKDSVECNAKAKSHCVNVSRIRDAYRRISALKGAPLDKFHRSVADCRSMGTVGRLYKSMCRKAKVEAGRKSESRDRTAGVRERAGRRRREQPFSEGFSN